METIAMCSTEEFKSLKQKAFRIIPRPLLWLVISEIPDYASVVYLALYDLAEGNTRHPGTVIISHHALSLKVRKSVSSIRRAIKKLKELGYISFKQTREPEKNYLPNIIQLGCPEKMLKKIQAEEPDRKKNTFSSVSLSNTTSPSLECHKIIAAPAQTAVLYERYKEDLVHLKKTGISPLLASKKAFENFSKEEVNNLQRHILELSKYQNQEFSSSQIPKMDRGCSKMNTIRSINNRDHNLQLTIEKASPVDKLKRVAEPHYFVVSKRHFEKSNSEATQLLSAEQRCTIIKKLKWMRKQTHEIHPAIQEKYPKIEVLIDEVSFHVMHRNSEKIHGFLHALRSAAKMIRNGTWTVPKRLIQTQIMQRERNSLLLKQAEIQQARNFSMSHMFRNFLENTSPSYLCVRN